MSTLCGYKCKKIRDVAEDFGMNEAQNTEICGCKCEKERDVAAEKEPFLAKNASEA